MKSCYSLIIVLALLAGCAPLTKNEQSGEVQLTPWNTATVNAPAPTAAPEHSAATPVPASTPTPTIHIVALGETISSIALRYGLNMNAVLAANPEIDPYALIVGNQVLIPLGNAQTQIGITAESLSLKMSEPECSQTPERGLWCFAMISNPLSEAAANLAVTFTLMNSAAEEVARQTVPAILNKLDPGDSLPAVAFFAAPVPGESKVSASLASAFPASQSEKTYFPVDTGNPLIELGGRLARVSGEAIIAADPGKTVDVWVAALAYDLQGNLLGVRRTESRVTLEHGKNLIFNLNVYSSASEISSVVVKAEALLVNK
jgi:LysM repeat protein